MITPITYQGNVSFRANLYALEVKSRFIDQAHADGYYTGYGNELAAEVVGTAIRVKTGAFVIQGRMNAIDEDERIEINIENGKVGLLCVRVETYHPRDQENAKLVYYHGASIEEIEAALIKQDVYSLESETSNRVYEYPIYSYAMSNDIITNLTKLIKPVADYNAVYQLAVQAAEAAQAAAEAADNAATAAVEAKTATFTEQVNNAETNADEAATSAGQAATSAADALTQASNAAADAATASDAATSANTSAMAASLSAGNAEASATAVEELARTMAQQGGTVIKDANDNPLIVLDLTNIIVDGGAC